MSEHITDAHVWSTPDHVRDDKGRSLARVAMSDGTVLLGVGVGAYVWTRMTHNQARELIDLLDAATSGGA